MKIVSYNVNGIRAAINKGFVEWLEEENPDIIQIQETKAMQNQVDVDMIRMLGYEIHWFAAEKKGYSGVATFTKIHPKNVVKGIGNEFFDAEGRFLRLDFENFTLINSYFPSGSSGDIRQEKKEEYLELVLNYTNELRKSHSNIIVSGDYNICHKAIDINHPEKHEDTSGFLPQERDWMDRFVASGFVDSFRKFNDKPEQYSWWSYRGGAKPKNLGWRIDYHMVSENIANALQNAWINPELSFSDHCPVFIELNL